MTTLNSFYCFYNDQSPKRIIEVLSIWYFFFDDIFLTKAKNLLHVFFHCYKLIVSHNKILKQPFQELMVIFQLVFEPEN